MEALETRSRFFTIMGWVCILLGISDLATSIHNHLSMLQFLRGATLQRDVNFAHVYFGIVCILNVLSSTGGWALWKRRPWAPLLTSVTGGAWLTHCAFVVWGTFPTFVETIKDLKISQPMLALHLGMSMLTIVVKLLVWLIVLGGLFRENARREFPPSRPLFTTLVFFVSAGTGMMALLLLYSTLLFIHLRYR